MNIVPDFLLIAISTYCCVQAYKRIVFNKNASIANFVLLIEFVFLVTPIIMNYVIGIPEYRTIYWYRVFLTSMNSERIALIYDTYIGLSIFLLHIYAKRYDLNESKRKKIRKHSNDINASNVILKLIISLSPFIYIVLSGNFSSYLQYGPTASRGLAGGRFNVIISTLILISVYAFSHYVFSNKVNKKSAVVLLIYSLAIAWLQGKRFIVALMGLVYLFYYSKSDISYEERRRLYYMVPIVFGGLVAFSYFYLIVIRPLSDTSFSSVYEMLRVDFGRDDVIKYVMHQEFFIKDPILNYRGESFLSTFLTFIPRSLWVSKPYPHYMYLTSKILNLPLLNLPAGTTPSWFEMCLANLGYFGFLFGVLSIPYMCYCADRIRSISNQLIIVILLSVLLTQSTDFYYIFLLIYIVQYISRKMFNDKKIIFVWR